jgi:hypothetical protein
MNGLSGLPEIYVRPFPAAGGPWQISTGGTSAVWSRTSREIFYVNAWDSRIMVTSYSVNGNSFTPTKPRLWNNVRVDRFDLMPDGKRAVVVPAAEQKELTHATFLLNFMDELRRR